MFRLLAHDGSVLAVVVYLSDQEWAPETEEKLSVLLQVYAGSLENLRLRERKLGALGRAADGSLSRGFKFSLLALGLTLAAMFIPVRQFVIAPAEIISLDSVAVTSPVEGIIASVPVRPNESVKAGDVLVKLDDTTIRNRLEGARQALEVARAEFLAGVHRSMITSDRGTEVGVLRGRINERLAEVAFLEEQLGLLDLRASRAGIAVYGQINDLIGKPVSPGQKVMELADPSRIGVQVWVPVADAINVRAGLRFNLMLYSDPLTARGATLEQTSYQAIRSPDGVAAYRLRATLDTQEVSRLGLRGNAKIDGEPVALGYFLFRRPIVVIRQWLGI
jgi:multidrug efflux pump subunit AcrA (membrane-fusion protein)